MTTQASPRETSRTRLKIPPIFPSKRIPKILLAVVEANEARLDQRVRLATTDPRDPMVPEVPPDRKGRKDRKEIEGRPALPVRLMNPILPARTTTRTNSSRDLTLKKTFELPTSLPSMVPPRPLTLG